MPSREITRADFKAAFNEPDPRDGFTQEERLRAFDEQSVIRGLTEVIGASHVLITGRMGNGVSLVATALAKLAHQTGAHGVRDAKCVPRVRTGD